MEPRNGSRFSILVFPWIAHGHVFPYLELSKNLSNYNFHIYFCSTAINLDCIKKSLPEKSDSIQLVELQLPAFPDLPPHLHTTKNVPPNLMPRLLQAFQMSVSSFSEIIRNLKPDLLIYDGFQPWAAEIASSMSIPAVHFLTTGAAASSFAYHDLTVKDSTFPYPGLYLKDYERKALQEDMDQFKTDGDEADFSFDHYQLCYDILLIKSSRGVEGKYVDYLSVLCQKNVVPVGPLVSQSYNGENDSKIVDWLSKKPKFSTVFISFGSENYLSKDQMEEIAKGLELCNVNFIWVVRSAVGEKIDINKVLPKGFLDRIKERGIIMQGWAPQVKILAHKSVGAFMSHCGMSSTIEGFYFGVPIIAVPLKLDQPLNARLVVEAGVGVEVARDKDGNFRSDEFADSINKVFLGTSGEELRKRATELSEKMRNEEQESMKEAAQQLSRVCMKSKSLMIN
ncbi:crocetin glucoside glucosyltransferase-like [Dorcoceras hygrometricum]|uniref:Glycosyltransferase n=1 Tax=Dorcoceras hygrometricum TaxID=472368 RepID=A0A2Z6ZZK1_9LAMI|nr:crocetin glucoside glucosyltransferase-like [Dorcoceras hygrometricum]